MGQLQLNSLLVLHCRQDKVDRLDLVDSACTFVCASSNCANIFGNFPWQHIITASDSQLDLLIKFFICCVDSWTNIIFLLRLVHNDKKSQIWGEEIEVLVGVLFQLNLIHCLCFAINWYRSDGGAGKSLLLIACDFCSNLQDNEDISHSLEL